MSDIQVENHGSIFLFRPITDEGREWITEHVATDAMWMGGALVVEHRFAGEFAEGAMSDGLRVEWTMSTKQILIRLTPEQHKRVVARAERWKRRSKNYRSTNDYVLMKLLGEEHEQERTPPGGGTEPHPAGV